MLITKLAKDPGLCWYRWISGISCAVSIYIHMGKVKVHWRKWKYGEDISCNLEYMDKCVRMKYKLSKVGEKHTHTYVYTHNPASVIVIKQLIGFTEQGGKESKGTW